MLGGVLKGQLFLPQQLKISTPRGQLCFPPPPPPRRKTTMAALEPDYLSTARRVKSVVGQLPKVWTHELVLL